MAKLYNCTIELKASTDQSFLVIWGWPEYPGSLRLTSVLGSLRLTLVLWEPGTLIYLIITSSLPVSSFSPFSSFYQSLVNQLYTCTVCLLVCLDTRSPGSQTRSPGGVSRAMFLHPTPKTWLGLGASAKPWSTFFFFNWQLKFTSRHSR